MFGALVILIRNVMGTACFNKTRGKAIGLHCKAITNFCNTVGLDGKTRQNLIRLAKSNGHRLGFMV